MFNLEKLRGVELIPVPEKAPKTGGGVSIPKQPENGGHLRVTKSGRVTPSAAFLEKYSLEYAPKIETPDPEGNITVSIIGNGLDIFSSEKWSMVKGLLDEEVLFVAIVPRQGNGKIDLWGSCQYKDGAPVSSVMTQGPSTFGKALVELLADAYKVDWETVKYVDLKVLVDVPMQSPTNTYHIPKVVARGDNKGKASYQRRENISIFPLTMVEVPVVAETEAEKDVVTEPLTEAQSTTTANDALFEAKTPVTQEEPAPKEVEQSTGPGNAPLELKTEEVPTSGNNTLASLL